ncbi:lysophospholipase [Caenimonas sedimenti]|uniref:Lysophospholipase n=1 Tax=Caenimonas sedimenti TaxID=2596921 RepID=A0A562ZYE2_9BURK|nr:alpha/beta fold hydrolase [Caenimonas sedimenti]TWO73398.1 lysophospholipase [Caenimonas sedimenti]
MSKGFRQVEIPAADGQPIPVLSWLPEASVRGVVQVAHGMGEHAARYGRLAEALTAAGFAVYANNHRGHGEAARVESQRGNFGAAGFPDIVRDMLSVTEFASVQHPGLAITLFGHSMGSFAAQVYALDHSARIAALALSGTAATDLLMAVRGPQRKLEDYAGTAPARTPFDWLSRDDAEVDKYIADPLCGFSLTKASRASMVEACARTALPGAFGALRPELPVYLFTGDQDPVNNKLEWFHPLVERLRAAGLRDVTTRMYPGARHEVLNEINRDEVTADFLVWLGRVA